MSISQNIIRISGLSLLLLCSLPELTQAQEIRRNAEGEQIIVYPDGRVTYFNGDPVPDADSSSYPVLQASITPLDGPVSITEQDLYKIAIRRAQLTEEASSIARQRVIEARRNRVRLEQKLVQVLDRGEGEQLGRLQRQLQLARKVEVEAADEALEAEKLSVRASSLTTRGGYVEDYNRRQQSRSELRQATEVSRSFVATPAVASSFRGFPTTSTSSITSYPPRENCTLAYQGQDTESGMTKLVAPQQLLFTHTDDRLRPYLKEREYLRCDGYLHTLGGYRFLTLEFTFAYPNAREAYGLIEQGSILTIKLFNGEYINLRSGRMSKGVYDTKTELLTYTVYYPLDRADIPLLRNSEVDFLRVFWSSGYEEYEVYQMDFFQRQLECLGE